MRHPFRVWFVIIVVFLAARVGHAAASDSLRQVFLDPPVEAKPRGYWVWPHGNFDYSVMRHELAEFNAKGLGGVDIFDLGIGDTAKVIPPGPGFLSVEQVDGIAFALDEAKRLGLKMGLIVSSSWNAGAKQFQVSGDELSPGQRVLLDLGEVREVARVYVNGRDAGHSSFAPHVLDVTDLLRAAEVVVDLKQP